LYPALKSFDYSAWPAKEIAKSRNGRAKPTYAAVVKYDTFEKYRQAPSTYADNYHYPSAWTQYEDARRQDRILRQRHTVQGARDLN
jgi:hypothetical protein